MDTDLHLRASRSRATRDRKLFSNLQDPAVASSSKSKDHHSKSSNTAATSAPNKSKKDRSRCKATAITIPPAQPQCSSPITCPERTPRELKTPRNRTGTESLTQARSKLDTGQRNNSPSLSPKDAYVKVFSVTSKKDAYPTPVSISPALDFDQPGSRSNDSSRSPSLSPSPKNRGVSLSPHDPHRGHRFGSPTPKSSSGSGTNSSRGSSLSPVATLKEPSLTSTHHQSRGRNSTSLSPSSASKPVSVPGRRAGKEDSRLHAGLDAPHPQSSPPRDIFSPVPCERVPDEGLRGIAEREPRHSPSSDDNDAGGSSFPEIKVEDCDDDDNAPELQLGNTYGQVRKSASFPNYTDADDWQGGGDRDGNNMTSLNVPLPFVKRRTTNGRLIVGTNNTLTLAGALSKMWSRSEGNIPFTFTVEDQETIQIPGTLTSETETDRWHNERSSAGSSRSSSQNSSTNSLTSQRQARRDQDLDTPRSARQPLFRSSSGHRHELLSPSLREELVSRPTFRMSPEPSRDDIERNIQFLSPQPKRRLGPRY